MMTRRQAALACATAIAGFGAEKRINRGERVQIRRLPESAIQPQLALDDQGTLHLVYYTGDAHKGDLDYVRSADFGKSFSNALRVNSQPGSAVAAGTIRGAQLAAGNRGLVHIAWNGSMQAKPEGPLNPDSGKHGMPMLYARLNESHSAFEPQRNLMLHSFGLDGGGSVAANHAGAVYVAWHGIGESEGSGTGKEGEARRRVWIAKSADNGRSFANEEGAWPQETGACGCCGMKIFADRQNNVYLLYRSATNSVHRDIYLLTSQAKGGGFEGRLLHSWDVNACPMSSMDFAENGNVVVGAWETGGQVYWARLDRGAEGKTQPVPAPGEGKGRKHPRLAVNQKGEVLLVWTEGTAWQKGGSLAYQRYDRVGQPLGEKGTAAGVPTWSFGAAVAAADDEFVVFY